MINVSVYRGGFVNDMILKRDQDYIKLKALRKNISDSYILNYYEFTFTGNLIRMSKDSALKDSLYKDFMASSGNPVYRSKLREMYDNYVNFGDRKMAPEFVYASAAGENVSLKSLRGKYVYIDVWATWCAPCKQELPHLAKVEEDYKERNIQFISLSVDNPADRNKWQEFIRTNRLKGLQLMTENAFESAFIQKFNINSIPRFILIDPEGKDRFGRCKAAFRSGVTDATGCLAHVEIMDSPAILA